MFKVLATVVTVPMALAAGFVLGMTLGMQFGANDEMLLILGGLFSGMTVTNLLNIIW